MIRSPGVRPGDDPAVVLTVASVPLYAYTAFAILAGIAALGCAPDAYECPL